MAGRKRAGYRPECPRPGHKHSNVRRYGYHGKEGHRRVRWKCVPLNGDKPHEFSEVLPRQTTHSGFCEECERGYAHHEGPQSAREYAFSIREVASALMRVGQGASYREAATYARERAGRWPTSRGGRVRRTRHAQLVSDWIEVFAPVVYEPHRDFAWPKSGSILLDELPFRINNGIQRGRPAFTILAAMGYDEKAGEKGDGAMRLWRLEAIPSQPAQARGDWERFMRSLEGEPRRIVCDQASQITKAVGAVFPNADIHYCEHHLRQSCHRHLKAEGLDVAGTPAYDAIERAFSSLRAFEDLKLAWLATGSRRLGRHVWRIEPLVLRQLEQRSSWPSQANPVSTGALDKALDWLRTQLSWRAGLFTNRERMDRALLLLLMQQNGHANEATYAASIRDWLRTNRGRPNTPRRAVTDRAGRMSLRP